MKRIEVRLPEIDKPKALVLRVYCLLFIIISSCTTIGKGPYRPGNQQEFEVTLNDSLYSFSNLNLKISEGSFLVLQQKVIWEGHYTNHTDGSTSMTTSTTGIVQNENRIWLHPPRIGPLEMLEAFPFPEVRFPLEVGRTWESSINVVSGFKELNGKKVSSVYKVIRDSVSVSNGETEIWEIHASAQVEDDPRLFKVKYHFSSDTGFNFFNYTIDEKPFARIKLVMNG